MVRTSPTRMVRLALVVLLAIDAHLTGERQLLRQRSGSWRAGRTRATCRCAACVSAVTRRPRLAVRIPRFQLRLQRGERGEGRVGIHGLLPLLADARRPGPDRTRGNVGRALSPPRRGRRGPFFWPFSPLSGEAFGLPRRVRGPSDGLSRPGRSWPCRLRACRSCPCRSWAGDPVRHGGRPDDRRGAGAIPR